MHQPTASQGFHSPEMLRYIERRNSAHLEAWHCRIGINSGPVIGSLVGVQKYVYDIFGPTRLYFLERELPRMR